MNAHAEISPSQLSAVFACPGRPRICRGLPDLPTSDHAMEGTAAHLIGSCALRFNKVAKAYAGEAVAVFEDGATRGPAMFSGPAPRKSKIFRVTPDMVSAVQSYIDFIRDLKPKKLHVEEQLDMRHLHPEFYGTCDCWFVVENTLYVIDYKHGRGYLVEAVDNVQLLSYASGAVREAEKAGHTIKKIVGVISQPRHINGGNSIWTFSQQELDTWISKKLIPLFKLIDSPDAPAIPGLDQCRYCKATAMDPKTGSPYCREYVGHMEREAQLVFASVDTAGSAPEVSAMTDAQLATIVSFSSVLETLIASAKNEAYLRAVNGREIPGHKLVRTAKRRSWESPESEKKAFTLLSVFGYDVTKEVPRTCSDIMSSLSKDDAKLFLPLLDNTEPGLTLVPESDRRKAQSPRPEIDAYFDEI